VGGVREEPAAILLLPGVFVVDGRPEGFDINDEALRAGEGEINPVGAPDRRSRGSKRFSLCLLRFVHLPCSRWMTRRR